VAVLVSYSEDLRQRPAKSTSRALVLYGGMIADDIVAQCRVAALIGMLNAALLALAKPTPALSLANDGEGPRKESFLILESARFTLLLEAIRTS